MPKILLFLVKGILKAKVLLYNKNNTKSVCLSTVYNKRFIRFFPEGGFFSGVFPAGGCLFV